MSNLFLQGIATETSRCFIGKGGNVLYLNPGCFDLSVRSGTEVNLLIDHDEEHSLATTDDRLEIYAGAKSIAFRFTIPDSWNSEFSEQADDYDTYLPVSIGLKNGDAELIDLDGVKITAVVEAKLVEISILSKAPAIHSTYARVVSADTCGTLKGDYETGRLDLVGRYIGVHRALKARENGGVIKFNHTTTPYDRAANRFQRLLQGLA